jgi:hypothetical protein
VVGIPSNAVRPGTSKKGLTQVYRRKLESTPIHSSMNQ